MDEALSGQDVRTGEMSEVGAQLFWLIEREFGWITQSAIERIVDLVEARFEVTPKPVVTDAVLGEYVRCASVWSNCNACNADRGQWFRSYLDEAGLMIVRTEGRDDVR